MTRQPQAHHLPSRFEKKKELYPNCSREGTVQINYVCVSVYLSVCLSVCLSICVDYLTDPHHMIHYFVCLTSVVPVWPWISERGAAWGWCISTALTGYLSSLWIWSRLSWRFSWWCAWQNPCKIKLESGKSSAIWSEWDSWSNTTSY